ncbi:MAG: hypothetical protein LBC06_00675 [Rickettsiales bacterium]|jgi:hypothetical protein|nr:hypothetical protein [Rickettsiales bacterium]
MSFEHILIYGITLLVGIKILLLCRKLCKKLIRRVIFFKKTLKEDWEEDRKYNELYREKKQTELMKHQEMLREKQKDIQVYKEDPEIVDIAKPVGKWTKMVMLSGGFMQRLAQLINREGGQKGFWELFIKAQASTKGKYKGKGR